MTNINFKVVDKAWGYELCIENNPEYCAKILHFNSGAEFSYHFHILKKETWYCSSGEFTLTLKDSSTGKDYSMPFTPGDSLTIERGQAHQLKCIVSGDIFEASTTHFDSDSYRIAPGDSQKNE